MTRRGNIKPRKWRLGFIIILLILGLLIPAPTPVMANSGDAIFWTAMSLVSVLGAGAIGYTAWELSRPDQPRFFNGEFYAAGYLGMALTPDQDLRYPNGFSLNTGTTMSREGSATLRNNQFANSLTGGVKLGYFFHRIPYLGLEGESSVSNSYVNRRTLSTSRPIQGYTTATVPNDFWINWTTALHIVGRYGFFPNNEVPFGRLQPYVGIGPAVVCLYEEVDSAKNFALDIMAGVRYMVTKHFSAFVEYKYNRQWDVEIESHPFYLPNGTVGRGATHFDFSCHKVVLGLGYHW